MLEKLLSDAPLLKAAVLVGAVLNAIALPILISLIWRLHDDRGKLLEAKSPKAVWDQVSALRQLQDWQVEQLRAEISASDERLRTVLLVCEAHPYDTHWRLVEEAKHNDTTLWFATFDDEDRRFMEEVQSVVGKDRLRKSAQGCWNPFYEYENHLEAQIKKLNKSKGKPPNTAAQADT